jgi:hypothetical protein
MFDRPDDMVISLENVIAAHAGVVRTKVEASVTEKELIELHQAQGTSRAVLGW